MNLMQALMDRDLEWDPGGKLTLLFRATEMAGECGEACNVIKKLERARLGLRGSTATIEDLSQELADVVITAYLTALTAKIDMDQAIKDKFNASSEKLGLRARL